MSDPTTMPAPGPVYGDFGDAGLPREKLSVLAVISVVFGLICVPGFGLIGIMLAVVALVRISTSKGRIGGAGFALAGIMLSTLATALWVGLALGGVQGMQLIGGRVERVMIAVRDADLPRVTREFTETHGAMIDEEVLATFNGAVAEQLGAYTTTPRQFRELGRVRKVIDENSDLWWQEGEIIQALWPVAFEKGEAIVLMRLEASSLLNLYGAQMRNLGVRLDDGSEIWLLELDEQDPDSPAPDQQQGADQRAPAPDRP